MSLVNLLGLLIVLLGLALAFLGLVANVQHIIFFSFPISLFGAFMLTGAKM